MREQLFVHGHTVVAEHVENLFDAGRPVGWGRVFRGRAGRSCWVHASLPVVSWRRSTPGPGTDPTHVARVLELHVEHALDPGVSIERVHLYDGAHRVADLDDDSSLPTAGTQPWTRRSTWTTPPLVFRGAMGVSIQLFFARDANATLVGVGTTYEILED